MRVRRGARHAHGRNVPFGRTKRGAHACAQGHAANCIPRGFEAASRRRQALEPRALAREDAAVRQGGLECHEQRHAHTWAPPAPAHNVDERMGKLGVRASWRVRRMRCRSCERPVSDDAARIPRAVRFCLQVLAAVVAAHVWVADGKGAEQRR